MYRHASHEENLATYYITLPYLIYFFGGIIFFPLGILPKLNLSYKTIEILFWIWFLGLIFLPPLASKLITLKLEREKRKEVDRI